MNRNWKFVGPTGRIFAGHTETLSISAERVCEEIDEGRLAWGVEIKYIWIDQGNNLNEGGFCVGRELRFNDEMEYQDALKYLFSLREASSEHPRFWKK